MPADLYAPGRAPPPHLSPFVDHEAEGYTPDFAQTDAARRARERAAGLAVDAGFMEGEDGEDGGGGGGDGDAGQEDAAALEREYRRGLAKEVAGGAGAVEALDEPSVDEEGDEEDEGAAAEAPTRAKRAAAAAAGEGDGGEEGLAAMMMSRKQRKFYERIQRAQAGKAERVGALEARKAALDKAEGREPVPAARKTRGQRAEQQQQQAAVATVEPAMKKRRK
ncbi:hypothetical protein MNEG_15224 [Monoraphidium neglectum]|uniref:Uncharacterized protein n=1 Tax=Monoraphidium neglectum TaxID=145388 RepID=A0A0D2MBM9_9CHLO|nr:hypothetical protein MNEG_15224 [Monoraphidium neglectum]KIY92740.1 hypothetical protein MNEG_15224 [Monoraphidium neglectum]|eukprot:XP_013891760.1 hypothetical protein MNEG_15224 [Monoraphidium neglectum]